MNSRICVKIAITYLKKSRAKSSGNYLDHKTTKAVRKVSNWKLFLPLYIIFINFINNSSM